jgi:hypothetical protein
MTNIPGEVFTLHFIHPKRKLGSATIAVLIRSDGTFTERDIDYLTVVPEGTPSVTSLPSTIDTPTHWSTLELALLCDLHAGVDIDWDLPNLGKVGTRFVKLGLMQAPANSDNYHLTIKGHGFLNHLKNIKFL